MEAVRDVIDLQALLDKAKTMPIKLIALEWLEIEGNPTHWPATNDGRNRADAWLKKQGHDDEYVRQHMIHYKETGRPMYDIVTDLNDRMRELGIVPQEGGFSYQYYEWQTAEEQRVLMNRNDTLDRYTSQMLYEAQNSRDHARPLPMGYRWMGVYPVTGGSEGYYIHVDLLFQESREKSPKLKAMRDLLARIEGLPYDAQTYDSDKKLVEAAKTAYYGDDFSYRKMLAMAKTWEWDNACACAAVAARLLGA